MRLPSDSAYSLYSLQALRCCLGEQPRVALDVALEPPARTAAGAAPLRHGDLRHGDDRKARPTGQDPQAGGELDRAACGGEEPTLSQQLVEHVDALGRATRQQGNSISDRRHSCSALAPGSRAATAVADGSAAAVAGGTAGQEERDGSPSLLQRAACSGSAARRPSVPRPSVPKPRYPSHRAQAVGTKPSVPKPSVPKPSIPKLRSHGLRLLQQMACRIVPAPWRWYT